MSGQHGSRLPCLRFGSGDLPFQLRQTVVGVFELVEVCPALFKQRRQSLLVGSVFLFQPAQLCQPLFQPVVLIRGKIER